jgi:hypothetical protein
MANIDLRMAVIVDTKQMEEARKLMEESDKKFLQRMEKVSKSMNDLLKKLGPTMREFVEAFSNGISSICSKMDELIVKN